MSTRPLRASLRLRGEDGCEKIAMAAAAAAGRYAGLPHARLDDLQTAVAEACLNSFEHGSRARPQAPVWVTFTSSPDYLQVVVRDRGPGFSLDGGPPPSIERLLGEGGTDRGWGLFLIKNLADRLDVRTDHAGCHLELRFNLVGKARGA